MDFSLHFILVSILLGVGLAMDAFSVSLANGLNEPKMNIGRKCFIAGTFAVFQAAMPLIGWICVHTIVQKFRAFEKFIPWIALILLGYIGGKMLVEGIREAKDADTNASVVKKTAKLGIGMLLVQGIATSIDALSVGFTIADYGLLMAIVCALIIAIVTFIICMVGLFLGTRFGTKFAGKAGILGGIILIGIGIEIFLSGILGGCSNTYTVTEDTEFGSVFVKTSIEDFNKAGYTYGDSVDVEFSNGYVLKDIPYYDGFYERVNKPLVCGYPGYEYITISYSSGEPMWEKSGCKENDSVTITVNKMGKYIDQQNTMASVYSNDRNDYESDIVFSNYRVMNCGRLRKDMFYRGASPVNNQNNRASITDSLIEKDGIKYIFDLADTQEKIDQYVGGKDFDSPYALSLIEDGKASLLGLSASYRGDDFHKKLVTGIREMMTCEGPYYIHCTEGKDRTGFVCILFEILSDATYDEIEYDYMVTYDNYYGITQNSDPDKYSALEELRFYDMLWWLADVPDGTDLTKIDLKPGAIKYLQDGGMSEEEIEEFIDFLTE